MHDKTAHRVNIHTDYMAPFLQPRKQQPVVSCNFLRQGMAGVKSQLMDTAAVVSYDFLRQGVAGVNSQLMDTAAVVSYDFLRQGMAGVKS